MAVLVYIHVNQVSFNFKDILDPLNIFLLILAINFSIIRFFIECGKVKAKIKDL